jgi:Ca2+-binding RTX toxin-like protein
MPTIAGTADGETLNGTSGGDSLYGYGGNDTIYGFTGNDVIDGGDGADLMNGGEGNDSYFVDNQLDVIVESFGEGDDSLHTSVSYVLSETASIETLTTTNALSTSAINLTGNSYGNSLYGNAGNNVLNGGGGADYLVGLGGNDHYIIDNAGDRIVEFAGEGDDSLHTSVSFILDADVSIETLTTTNEMGIAAIDLIGNNLGNSLYGNAGANILSGGGGDDYLVGMGGNDQIIGGIGADHLVGGPGADRFIFSDLESGDVIHDFVSGTDTIDLGDLIADRAYIHFLANGTFTGTEGEVRFADGLLQVDMDGDRFADLTIAVIGQVIATDLTFDGNPFGTGGSPWDY